MARRPLTVELDEEVVLAAQAEAARQGRSEAAVVEQALREHLARQGSATDQVWTRNRKDALGEDEALALASAGGGRSADRDRHLSSPPD